MNTITVSGTKEKMEALVAAAQEDKLLEFLNPIGEWEYHKAWEEWGTKWEVREATVDGPEEIEGDYWAYLSFDTAWSPPIAAYRNAQEIHDIKISASYYEPGMCFVGLFDLDEDSCYEVDFTDENWSDNIPTDLISEWALDDDYENWKEYQEEYEDA
jgi:hypothetical protein